MHPINVLNNFVDSSFFIGISKKSFVPNSAFILLWNPRHTPVCLWFQTRICLDFVPKSFFWDGLYWLKIFLRTESLSGNRFGKSDTLYLMNTRCHEFVQELRMSDMTNAYRITIIKRWAPQVTDPATKSGIRILGTILNSYQISKMPPISQALNPLNTSQRLSGLDHVPDLHAPWRPTSPGPSSNTFMNADSSSTVILSWTPWNIPAPEPHPKPLKNRSTKLNSQPFQITINPKNDIPLSITIQLRFDESNIGLYAINIKLLTSWNKLSDKQLFVTFNFTLSQFEEVICLQAISKKRFWHGIKAYPSWKPQAYWSMSRIFKED
jgi:hypothetical protein